MEQGYSQSLSILENNSNSTRYDLSKSLNVFVNCLKDQNEKNYYFLDNNLALMKLFQLYPHGESSDDDSGSDSNKLAIDLNIVLIALLKSLMALSVSNDGCDYDLHACLLPFHFKNEKKILLVKELASHLQESKFSLFWEATSRPDCAEIIKLVPGFEDAIRYYALKSVRAVYRGDPPAQVLSELLNLPQDKLQTFITSYKPMQVITLDQKSEEESIAPSSSIPVLTTGNAISPALNFTEVVRLLNKLR